MPEQGEPDIESIFDGDSPTGIWGLMRLWFGLSLPVSRKNYALSGFGLMGFKYVVEAGLIGHFSGRFFSPLDFVNPLLSMRQEFFKPPVPEWLPWAMFFWTLPFLWVAAGMSIRRATDCGMSSWWGLIVLVPFLNLVGLILLCLFPH